MNIWNRIQKFLEQHLNFRVRSRLAPHTQVVWWPEVLWSTVALGTAFKWYSMLG